MTGIVGYRGLMLAAGAGEIDNFDTNTLGLYTLYRDSGTPNVSIASGYLNFADPIGAVQTVVARTGSVLGNCELSSVLTEAHDAGIAFRLTNNSNYYVATISDNGDTVPASRSTIALYRRSGGVFTQMGTRVSIPTFVRGTPTELKVTAIGSAISVRVNGVTYLNVTDSNHVSGLHGPRSHAAPSKFDSYAWAPA